MERKKIKEKIKFRLPDATEKTRDVYLGWADKFFDEVGVKDVYDEDDYGRAMEWARKQNYSDNSKRVFHYVIKKIFSATQSPWVGRKAPKVRERKRTGIMPEDDIRKAIQFAKEDSYDEKRTTAIVLSTIYGLRAKEIIDINPRSMKEGKIRVQALKGGELRVHLIPEPIEKYLTRKRIEKLNDLKRYKIFDFFHDVFDPINEQARSSVHYRKVKDKENPVKKPWGWHSIRRALVNKFDKILREKDDIEVDREDVKSFMRWAKSEGTYDEYIYRSGKEEETIDIDQDKRIFKVHPFLKWWKEA